MQRRYKGLPRFPDKHILQKEESIRTERMAELQVWLSQFTSRVNVLKDG